ncbi:hypothetical protein ACFLYS_00360 [Chloroflexota bacterium]
MGIFDVFKPTQEELKAKEEAEKVWTLIGNEEWDKLAAIGEPAAQTLISYLKEFVKNVDRAMPGGTKTLPGPDLDNILISLDFLIPALQTLGKIGTLEAWLRELDLRLNLLLPRSLSHMAMMGNNDDEREVAGTKFFEHYYTLVPVFSESLVSMSKSNIEPFLKTMNNSNEFGFSLFLDMPLVWAACEIGDSRAIEPTVDWIFNVGSQATYADPRGLLWIYKNKLLPATDRIREIIPLQVLKKLLGDYTDLIMDVLAWEITNISLETEEVELDSSRCYDAIKKLCDIDTPISSNILHKVSKLDKLITGSDRLFSGGTTTYTIHYLDFNKYNKIAKDELKRRGNPRYDPSVYLNEDVWSI